MSEFRYIVRIADTDLQGAASLKYELTKIKGVGVNLAEAVVMKTDLNKVKRVGDLKDAEIQKIEDLLANPKAFGIPPWLFNRQRDPESGKNVHTIGPDLTLQLRSDLERMQETRSWKGIRHALGLKVRGQHTKTTARSGRVVGVRRKTIREEARREGARQ